MRNRITISEAAVIGARLREARLRAKKGITEIGNTTGVHHSQVSRCERGDFKTISPNVQKLCKAMNVKHPKVPEIWMSQEDLRTRFDALLADLPGSAAAFACLFDVLEDSRARKSSRRRRRP